MIDEIINELKKIIPVVCYGSVTEKDMAIATRWEFAVVTRDGLVRDGMRWYQVYTVSYVDEDYIQEGFEFDIISAMKRIGLRLLEDQRIEYDNATVTKNQTKVEAVTIQFKKEILHILMLVNIQSLFLKKMIVLLNVVVVVAGLKFVFPG